MGVRRGSRWLGFVFIVLVGGLFALSGLSIPDSVDVLVGFGTLFAVGVTFVLAGFETPVTERFGWHRLFALGFVLMGVTQLLSALFLNSDGGIFYVVLNLVGAGLFAFIGFDIARNGPHFDIDPSETA